MDEGSRHCRNRSVSGRHFCLSVLRTRPRRAFVTRHTPLCSPRELPFPKRRLTGEGRRARGYRVSCGLSGGRSGAQTQVPMGCRRRSRLATLLSKNAALEVNEYLCRPPQNLTALTGRVSAAARTGKYLSHAILHGVLLSDSVAVLVPKNFKRLRPASMPQGSALYFRSFSGRGIIAATRFPYSTDSGVLPKGDMTWLLAP